MAVSRFSRRVLIILGLGVAVPALILAITGVFLTLRIARAVEDESVKYNTYLAQQIAESFEQEVMAHLRRSIAPAENAARNGATIGEITALLRDETGEFEGAHLVGVDELDGYSLLIIESQPLIYAPGTGARRSQYFAGLLLRDPVGQVAGAGGWWIDARTFLTGHLESVIQDRLPSNPRMYGGFESTRRLAVQLYAPDNAEIGRVRNPGPGRTARVEALQGPFEGYSVRVSATANSPVVWTGRFVVIELVFIGLMGLVILLATIFGLRYTIRQIELAQLKAGFVSNVTHELKTPIAIIRLAVESLEMRRVSTPEEANKFLAMISRETTRLSTLVEKILEFARLEAGQRVFQFEEVDMAQIVRAAVDSLRPQLEHQEFSLTVDLPDSLPPVNGDAIALSQCVLNLIDNAIKYSRERKEIRIVAGVRDDEVTVAVSDRGIGIAAGDQKKIFEKFVRLENGLVHDVKGAGLGLSLVAQILRAHDGRIEVESVAGEGSTFTLVLPVASGMFKEQTEARRRAVS
jgi:signal transduction histidine kinase